MHSKKFLAAFLALSMTAAPQASVLASAENASAQESSEIHHKKAQTGNLMKMWRRKQKKLKQSRMLHR